jgi:27-O-demethylrifamycin SV methyltransferase
VTKDQPNTSGNSVGAHYDKITAAWIYLLGEDLHYGDFENPQTPLAAATARLTERMAAAGQLRPGLDVLDVGCGIGTPAMTVARRWGCRVTGISISDVGIDIARQRASKSDVADLVRFQHGDAMNNGLPDHSFDRVWVMESSHLMKDKPALFAECARVLRPGGILVLCDIIAHADLTIADTMRFARDFLLLDQVFGRARMVTLDEYSRLGGLNGLRVIQREDISRQVRPTFAGWRTNAGLHRQAVEALLGREATDRFVESTSVLERLWDLNKLGYGILAAEKRSA